MNKFLRKLVQLVHMQKLEPRAARFKVIVAMGLFSAAAGLCPALASPKPNQASTSPATLSNLIAQNSSSSKVNPRPNQQGRGTANGASPNGDEQVLEPDQGESSAALLSGTGVLIVIALGIVGLLVSRTRRSRNAAAAEGNGRVIFADKVWAETSEESNGPSPADRRQSTRSPAAAGPAKAGRTGNHTAATTPDSFFGAFRIELEVRNLVLGRHYRKEVVSSRAPEDRRAVEASLIKLLVATRREDERWRARLALEDGGFVAQECATLLMAPDAFDRITAARSLGEIKSDIAVPFLLEALFDNDPVVRNQTVLSIGELRTARAVAPLLELARRHPDIPDSLVNKALRACSGEGRDHNEASNEGALVGGLDGFDITKLLPASFVENLSDDESEEGLRDALVGVKSADLGKRLAATKELARFQVRSAVAALTAVARYDVEPNLRAQAISSLASINHESVFPAVLIGMADESREVRASAARSLSHLSFDRADAYIRVMETTDAETLPDVARACIKAGIVAQGIERLASSDRRQAYEAFSILSLLAKAKMTAPIVEAIANHMNLDIRLTAVRVLANTGQAEVLEQLKNLASKPGLCEELRTALLEAMYKLEQTIALDGLAATGSMPTEEFSGEPYGEPNGIKAESSSEVAAPTYEAK